MVQFYKNRSLAVGILVLLFALALPLVVGAEESRNSEREFAIRFTTGISPFLSGDAGEGDDAPDYDDLFKSGFGAALEAEYRVNVYIILVGGLGYEEYSGKTHQGLEFDDLEVVPVYAGCRLSWPLSCSLKPFIRANIGSAHLSEVDLSWDSLSATYWDSGWVFFGDAGVGLEYQVDNWNFSADVGFRYTGAPDNNLKAADADAFWTVPVRLGVSYTF